MSSYSQVLKSIFTGGQEYTVLQLIKALINAVEQLAGHTVVDVSVSQTYPSQGEPTTVTLALSFDDDTTTNLSFTVPAGRQGIQGATGPQGEQGVGIRDCNIVQLSDDRFEIEFTLTDNTTIGTGWITLPEGPQGPQGATGAYVTSADFNVQGHLILTLSNGNTIDAGTIDHLPDGVSVNGEITASSISAQAGDFQDVTAQTIEQTNANYSKEFNFATASGLTITNVYNRFEVINSVLYLIANIRIKNTGDAGKKLGQGWGDPAYCTVTLNDSIASKIYDIAGTSVHASPAVDGTIITAVPVVVTKNIVESGTLVSLTSFRFSMVNKTGVNTVSCYFRPNEIVELQPDEEFILMGRIALTLI